MSLEQQKHKKKIKKLCRLPW